MRILCIQLRQMGDVMMTTCALRQLRTIYAQAEIVFMSEPLGANVYQNNPNVSRLWIIPRKPSIWAFATLLRRVYRERFDLVIDFFGNPKSAQITFASRAKERVGFDFRFRRYAYTRRVVLEDKGEYAARSKNRLIAHLGGRLDDTQIEFFTDEKARRYAREFSDRYGFDDKTIAFCVVSRRSYKMLDPTFFAEVGDALIAAGYKLFFVYGPSEKPLAETVFKRLERPQNAIIDYDMPNVQELKAILEFCALYVGVDGGSKHLSVTAKTPTVAIFNGVRAENWTAKGHSAFQIENGATPKEVIEACLLQLRKKEGGGNADRS
ncbi:MAG: glycosyltransferase family 9 protein [Helicobacteraceae bacterium]|nr:glycosyltransferase family 9 protein [Helicobacteraceae bacterium]